MVSRPEPFVLNNKTYRILQSTASEHAQKKKALLEHATRAVELQIRGPLALPDDTTKLMAPFVNVDSLLMTSVTASSLPFLPCRKKLKSLEVRDGRNQTLQHIRHYVNLEKLELYELLHNGTNEHRNLEHCLEITHLRRLRTFYASGFLTLDGSEPAEEALFERILQDKPQINRMTLFGRLSEAVVRSVATLPLKKLFLLHSEIGDAKLALLSFDTLEELRLHGEHKLTDLTPLQGSHLRVLQLGQDTLFDDAAFEVICSMPKLKELDLYACRLTDVQAEPLLQLSQKLRYLVLDSRHPRLSAEMRQRLKEAFSDKVSLAIMR